jgi:acyl-CoA reductase-like NAD-dependent aldehyde dehydrogenase
MRSILYPLAAGCCVIFKGSEFCPRTWWAIGNVLTEAGLPAGVLSVLFHRAEDAAQVTTALIEHRSIKKINFTGNLHEIRASRTLLTYFFQPQARPRWVALLQAKQARTSSLF